MDYWEILGHLNYLSNKAMANQWLHFFQCAPHTRTLSSKLAARKDGGHHTCITSISNENRLQGPVKNTVASTVYEAQCGRLHIIDLNEGM